MFKENRRVKLLTLGAMCSALFMVFLDSTVVYLALPSIQSSLQSDVSELQWIIDSYSLLLAALLMSGGTIGDRYGRKRIFLAGLVVFTVGSAICALAHTSWLLIIGRIVQGIGAAGVLPGTMSILTQTFTDRVERAQAFGIWSAVSGLAYVIGPFLGGSLVESLGWQSIFYLNIPIGVAGFILTSRIVAESRDPKTHPIDLPGQLLWVLSISGLTFALIEGREWGWTSPLIVTLFTVTLFGLAVFLIVERRSSHPMFPLRYFTNPTFTASVFVAISIGFGLFSVFFILTLFLQQVQGYSAIEAGLRFLPTTIAMIVTAPLAGRLAGRIGSRLPMTTGMTLAGMSLLLFLRVDVNTPYQNWWWIMMLLGMGIGFTMAPMVAAIIGTVPESRSGMASATSSTARELGGLLGIALVGTIVFEQFRNSLEQSLSELDLPQVIQERISSLASQGNMGRMESGGIPEGMDVAAIRSVVEDAFVKGMHNGMLVGGLAMIAGAIVAFLFVRKAHLGSPESYSKPVDVEDFTEEESMKL
ncbi:MFS transporter [Kroppenstedtia pulmonis]|uniref:MFS transporter n=1 Tax=Kroppenstedtia pulmonis TaxID=1380685 RepID=A0A7D3XI63_9BACL|nr:MFS transporter [Kroppenstedtia pulmonis]QKG83779.1 MFS transporter [Kroppenstedtia pulmonis]